MRVRFIDNGQTERRRAIETALRTQADALQMKLQLLDEDGSPWQEGDIVVFLGGNQPAGVTASPLGVVESLDDLAGRVLPVLQTAPHATHLPPVLKPINALIEERFGDQWPHAVVDEILARTFLRRSVRRVFLSYRRDDAQGIARQLHEALSRLGFEVFLDEVSIRPTEDFQRSLKAWLADADLVLVLASPRFEESRWTMEEISLAGVLNVGLLRVDWPAEIYRREDPAPFAGRSGWERPSITRSAALADVCAELQLSELVDLHGGVARDALEHEPARLVLTEHAAGALVGKALRARARAVRARLESLSTLAWDTFNTMGAVQWTKVAGDLELVTEGEGTTLVRVLPFRPSPSTLHRVWIDARRDGYDAAAVYYSEFDADAPEVAALGWLAQARHVEPPERTRIHMDLGGRRSP